MRVEIFWCMAFQAFVRRLVMKEQMWTHARPDIYVDGDQVSVDLTVWDVEHNGFGVIVKLWGKLLEEKEAAARKHCEGIKKRYGRETRVLWGLKVVFDGGVVGVWHDAVFLIDEYRVM
jgi:hypothetical protein